MNRGTALALVALAACALLCYATASAAAKPPIGIGINYNWWKLALESVRACRTAGEPRSVGTWIVPHYADPAVRAIVRSQLRAMRASGFTTLRILILHEHADASDSADSFASTDGSIAPADAAKLRAFVADIAAAGFTTLEVAPAFLSENELYCRDRAWGDCFDPRRTGENWRFIAATVRAVRAASGPLALRFDIANEDAPDPRMPAAALQHAKTYLTTIAGRFAAAFGDGWLISAARSDASPATETGDRAGLLVKDLAEAGLRPRYLELHSYSGDGNDLVESLDEMQGLAQTIDAGVILGEMSYHSGVQASAVTGWLKRNPGSRVIDLIQWPEYDPSHICAIDPVPPYTPGPLGGVNAAGADLP